jgi:hypothetical protein
VAGDRGEQTYATLGELKAATRAAVRAEVARKLGRTLDESDVAAVAAFEEELDVIRDHVGDADYHGTYRLIERSISEDAPAAFRLLETLQKLAADNEEQRVRAAEEGTQLAPAPFAPLVEAAMDPAVSRFRDHLRWFTTDEAKNAHKRSSRMTIVDPIHLRNKFWWSDEPSNRDRALVSLIAGNFPAVSGDDNLTVEDVIQKEMDTIAAAARRRTSRLPQPT